MKCIFGQLIYNILEELIIRRLHFKYHIKQKIPQTYCVCILVAYIFTVKSLLLHFSWSDVIILSQQVINGFTVRTITVIIIIIIIIIIVVIFIIINHYSISVIIIAMIIISIIVIRLHSWCYFCLKKQHHNLHHTHQYYTPMHLLYHFFHRLKICNIFFTPLYITCFSSWVFVSRGGGG